MGQVSRCPCWSMLNRKEKECSSEEQVMYSSFFHGQGVNPPQTWLSTVCAITTVFAFSQQSSWNSCDLNLCYDALKTRVSPFIDFLQVAQTFLNSPMLASIEFCTFLRGNDLEKGYAHLQSFSCITVGVVYLESTIPIVDEYNLIYLYVVLTVLLIFGLVFLRLLNDHCLLCFQIQDMFFTRDWSRPSSITLRSSSPRFERAMFAFQSQFQSVLYLQTNFSMFSLFQSMIRFNSFLSPYNFRIIPQQCSLQWLMASSFSWSSTPAISSSILNLQICYQFSFTLEVSASISSLASFKSISCASILLLASTTSLSKPYLCDSNYEIISCRCYLSALIDYLILVYLWLSLSYSIYSFSFRACFYPYRDCLRCQYLLQQKFMRQSACFFQTCTYDSCFQQRALNFLFSSQKKLALSLSWIIDFIRVILKVLF